jgi:hypothetical protein
MNSKRPSSRLGDAAATGSDEPADSQREVDAQQEALLPDASGTAVASRSEETAISKIRPDRPQNPFACGFSVAAGPSVEVCDIEPRKALVRWEYPQSECLRKFHIDVVRLPAKCLADSSPARSSEQLTEVGFFEVGAADSSYVLPQGTLERNSGRVRL